MIRHRSGHRASVLALVLLCVGLTACTSSVPESQTSTEPVPADTSAQETADTSAQETEEAVRGTRIRIVIGEQTLEARLWDNPAAQSLIDQLPLTLDFSDHGGQEVLAEPPQPLTMEGMPSGESAPAGTIGWYAPDGVIVLYYTNVGHFNGIVRIGELDGDVSLLTGWTSPRSVTIERAE